MKDNTFKDAYFHPALILVLFVFFVRFYSKTKIEIVFLLCYTFIKNCKVLKIDPNA